mmetsp:Transcript_41053/g.135277  ORF Transcript_41053/g.135277 Transcript_41053/m.135277 type:complete len:499 (-) Transcript_41053:18-1514(-)
MSAESVHGLCFPTARGERWSDSERFYLFPTEYTSELVSSAANWGWRFAERDAARSRLVGLESWQNTHHTTFQAPVIRELASHVACTNKSAEASVCVVAAPPRGRCERWEQICPGKTLVVVELGNVDLGAPLCASLWSRCLASPRLRRVVSQRPLLRSKPWRGRCSWADNGTIEMPYVGHARAASLEARRRTHRVAVAMMAGGHWLGDKNNMSRDWREPLLKACHRTKGCVPVQPNRFYATEPKPFRGNAPAEFLWAAGAAYASSTFCLQPPGDTFGRSAIVDALSVGCIPVFFHPRQLELWPRFWNASRVSEGPHTTAALDFTRGVNVEAAYRHLASLAGERVEELQRAVAQAAPAMVHRGEERAERGGAPPMDDAIDVLVRHVLAEGRAEARRDGGGEPTRSHAAALHGLRARRNRRAVLPSTVGSRVEDREADARTSQPGEPAATALPPRGQAAAAATRRFNCRTRERWGGAKRAWCCEHESLGCAVRWPEAGDVA